MEFKIYKNDIVIYLTDEITEKFSGLIAEKTTVFIEDNSSNNFITIVANAEKEEAKNIIICNKNIDILKKEFFDSFKNIHAAGGIVQNENKDLLFIFRRGKWDLPKGKVETGESIETAAEREIEEETGVKNLTLKKKIGETYHIYEEKGKTILKTSHWLYFCSHTLQNITPQIAEDIAEVKWINTKNIKEPMANTFQNIKDILTDFFDTP